LKRIVSAGYKKRPHRSHRCSVNVITLVGRPGRWPRAMQMSRRNMVERG